MGIAAVVSLAVGAASTIVQMRQASKASAARREASAVQSASEERRNILARRRAAREERLRRARVIAGAESMGAAGSSPALGATSALGASFQAQTAGQTGQTIAAQGISAANQRAADAETRGYAARGFGQIINSGLSLYQEYNTV